MRILTCVRLEILRASWAFNKFIVVYITVHILLLSYERVRISVWWAMRS